MAQHDLEVRERQARVLAGEALGAGALAALDRLDQPEVMAVGDDQDLARLGELGLGQHERGAGGGERQRDDALQRSLEQRAAGDLQQPRVEALVESDVALEGLVVGAVHQLLDRIVDGAAARAGRARAAPRSAANRAAVPSSTPRSSIASWMSACGELPHHVAAAGQPAQQALVLERGQREAQRRARDAEPLDQRQLRHPLARRELAAEDQLAQAQQRPHDLSLVGLARRRRCDRRVQSIPVGGAACRDLSRSAAKIGFLGVLLATCCMQRHLTSIRIASPGQIRGGFIPLGGGEIGEEVPIRLRVRPSVWLRSRRSWALMVLAGCGSSGSSSSSSASASSSSSQPLPAGGTSAAAPSGGGSSVDISSCGPKPGVKATGTPINIGTIDTKQPGTDFTDGPNMINAYFNCVNANGGVNGHPLKLFVQLDQTQPAQIAAAAKQLIQTDHVVGIDGVFDLLECTIDQAYWKQLGIYEMDAGIAPSAGRRPTAPPSTWDRATAPTARCSTRSAAARLARSCSCSPTCRAPATSPPARPRWPRRRTCRSPS